MGLFSKKKEIPKPAEMITFIEKAGGCLCTKSVLDGKARLKWCFREQSVNPADNGWRFLGDSDTEQYINTPGNNSVVDFNTVANIEPAVLGIYNMPVGTDLRFEVAKDGSRHFYDNNTGAEVKLML